jgi:hypothetical protein
MSKSKRTIGKAAAAAIVVVVFVIDAMIIDGLKGLAFTSYRSISESFLMANSSSFSVVVIIVLIDTAQFKTANNKVC